MKLWGKDEEKIDDPYAVAPVDAYTEWRYTLDDINNTITLVQYVNYNNTDVIVYDYYRINEKVYKTKIASSEAKTMYENYMFANKINLETVLFGNHVNVSETKSMAYMFGNCGKLTTINLGNNFDTNNVTNMEGMFCLSQCQNR